MSENFFSSQITDIFIQRQIHTTNATLNSHNMIEGLQEFIATRNSFKANINSLLEAKNHFSELIPEEKKLRDKYWLKNFTDLLYMIKNEDDIQIPLEIIKKNKNILTRFPENRMVVYFSKLLYALKKHDQLAELIRDPELKELFKIRPCTHILMLALVNEQRHMEACQIFLDYLQANESGEEVPNLTDLVEIFARSVFLLNSSESIAITERVLDILVRNNFKFTNFTIHNFICMLCIKQSIINSQLNRISGAFEDLEFIVELETDRKKTIFPDTLDHLEQAIGKDSENASSLKQRLDSLKQKANAKGLLNSRPLDNHLELERIRLSKYTKKYLSRNKDTNMSAPTSTQQRGLVKEETSNSLVAPPEACVAYESQRFNDVINSFEKCLVNLSSNEHSLSSKALDLLSQSIRSDTICSGNQLKRVLELVKEKTKSRWPINSQIDIFLRLIHIDPFYSLEFLAENDRSLQRLYPCIHKNLLSLGLSLIDQIDFALEQAEIILKVKPNTVNYQGVIFPKTIEALRVAVTNSRDNEQKNRLIDILIKTNVENRIVNYDLSSLNLSNSRLIGRQADYGSEI